MPRFLVSSIFIVALALLAWFGVRYLEEHKPEPERTPPREVGAVPVEVRELVARRLEFTLEAFGSLAPAREAQLAAEVSGRVLERLEPWRIGGFVAQGTQLLALDDGLLAQEVHVALAAAAQALAAERQSEVEAESAQALVPLALESLEFARYEEERLSSLSEGAVASKSQIDAASRSRNAAQIAVQEARAAAAVARAAQARAQAGSELAQAQLARAREQQARSKVFAPFDGYLLSEGPQVGTYLTRGVPCATVIDAGQLRVVIQIPEEDFARVDLGQQASVQLEARPETIFDGRVVGLGVRATNELRSLPVEIELTTSSESKQSSALPASRPRPGQFVRVTLKTGSVEGAIAISRDEFVWRQDRPVAFVMVVAGQGFRVEARELELGALIDGGYWIRQGLEAGERLILAPLGRLDGGEACVDAQRDQG